MALFFDKAETIHNRRRHSKVIDSYSVPQGYTVRQIFWTGILLYAVLFITYLVYWPGLWGLFILDDRSNLYTLERINQGDFDEFKHFIFSGISSTLGRPISLATFAPQFYAWPYAPYAFKYVNLMLHLLNGVLVFLLTLKLLELFKPKAPMMLAGALFTSALWLLHPLQVSTVSYVIQRMTELSALFTFSSIIAYVYGRQWTLTGRSGIGYLTMSTAIGLGLPLAVLSKENGILIPVFITVIEATLLATVPRPRNWGIWAIVFLALPIIILLGYFTIHAQAFFIGGYVHRDFTLIERLLSEARILLDYLRLFFIPQPSDLGLYFDNYPVSKGLLTPPSTFFSLIALSALVCGAVYLRRRAPMFSFGVLWYFGGHLLESSALPLELYFLHRNYVPLAGPALAAVYYIQVLMRCIEKRYMRLLTGIGVIIILGTFILITYTESLLWSDSLGQAKIWAQEKPDSKRARDWYGATLIMQGKIAAAQEIFREEALKYPKASTPYLQLAETACFGGILTHNDIEQSLSRLQQEPRMSIASINVMDTLVKHKEDGRCTELYSETLMKMIDAFFSNHHYDAVIDKLHILRARIFSIQRKHIEALKEYEKNYQLIPSIPILIDMVHTAAQAGRLDLVQTYVIRANNDLRLPRLQKVVYSDLIDNYQSQLDNILN